MRNFGFPDLRIFGFPDFRIMKIVKILEFTKILEKSGKLMKIMKTYENHEIIKNVFGREIWRVHAILDPPIDVARRAASIGGSKTPCTRQILRPKTFFMIS